MGLLDDYWRQYKDEVFKGKTSEDDFAYERKLWFGGVITAISHVTAVQDIDAVVGRVGEVVQELDRISKIEIDEAKNAVKETDPNVCYDGS